MTRRLFKTLPAAAFLAVAAALVPASAVAATKHTTSGAASAPSQPASTNTGGMSPDDPRFAPAKKAKIVNGVAVPPAGAPPEVVGMINAANSISGKPYKWGGGHGSFSDIGYDCSGSVSFALHGGGLLRSPLDSSSFMSWGRAGTGKWVTVYTNPGHAFMVIAGLRFDTGFRDNTVRGIHPGSGPRWGRKRSTAGFSARHPDGF